MELGYSQKSRSVYTISSVESGQSGQSFKSQSLSLKVSVMRPEPSHGRIGFQEKEGGASTSGAARFRTGAARFKKIVLFDQDLLKIRN